MRRVGKVLCAGGRDIKIKLQNADYPDVHYKGQDANLHRLRPATARRVAQMIEKCENASQVEQTYVWVVANGLLYYDPYYSLNSQAALAALRILAAGPHPLPSTANLDSLYKCIAGALQREEERLLPFFPDIAEQAAVVGIHSVLKTVLRVLHKPWMLSAFAAGDLLRLTRCFVSPTSPVSDVMRRDAALLFTNHVATQRRNNVNSCREAERLELFAVVCDARCPPHPAFATDIALGIHKGVTCTDVLWCAARTGVPLPDECKRVEERMSQCDVANLPASKLAQLVWGCAALRLGSPAFHAMVSLEVLDVPVTSFTVEEVQALVWSFDVLSFPGREGFLADAKVAGYHFQPPTPSERYDL